MTGKAILFEVEGAAAVITFNRPQQLNILNREMVAELVAALDRVAGDAAIRCLVLTGSGKEQ